MAASTHAGACPGRITAVFLTDPSRGLRAGEASRDKERLHLSCFLQLLGVKRSTGGGEGELSFPAGLMFAAALLIMLSGEEPVSERVSAQGFLEHRAGGGGSQPAPAVAAGL